MRTLLASTVFAMKLRRPKRLLLEALAWRLSKTFLLTPGATDAAGRVDFVQPSREASLQFCKNLADQPRH